MILISAVRFVAGDNIIRLGAPVGQVLSQKSREWRLVDFTSLDA